jgi:GNAT superfamily N-acetyltransferase
VNHSPYVIRPARPEDVSAVCAMVHELAGYERAPQQCHLTEAQLRAALFATQPALFGHVVVNAPGEHESGELCGFALWFLNYSTWEGVHGIHLEDLYVRPEARGTGAGRALLATLAGICLDRGYRRLDWSVIDWNPAREFYAALGAQAKQEWVPYRIEGEPLQALARSGGGRAPAGQHPSNSSPATSPPRPSASAAGVIPIQMPGPTRPHP